MGPTIALLQVLLPPSVGIDLMSQNASRNGAMLFEIALPACASVPSLPPTAATPGSAPVAADGGVLLPPPYTSAPDSTSTTSAQQQPQPPLPPGCPGRTHAGVLEFTAPEGTVLLPRKVVQSLYGSLEAQPLGTVVVSYKRLEKGSYVRLQPMSHGFHEAMSQPDGAGEAEAGVQQGAGAGAGGQQGDGEGDGEGAGGWGLREVLERELLAHSTLSEGDWLTVTHGGKEWPLRVSAGAAGRAGEALLMVQTGMFVTAVSVLGKLVDNRRPLQHMHTSLHALH